MKNNLLKLILTFLFGLCLLGMSIAKGSGNNKKIIQKNLVGNPTTTYIDINNLKALQSNIGFSDYNLNPNLEGLEYPKGSGKTAVFLSGFLWGGYIQGDSQVRIGGSTYNSGLQPGPILSSGQAADPTDPRWGIYRVRPDVYPGAPVVDLSNEATLEGIPVNQLQTQYEYDWTYWPAHGNTNAPDLGAPFKDVNGDGIYEPNIDIPGVPGAAQTIFYVANDEDSRATDSLYGTSPLGIEIHATYWAYNQAGILNNSYFKKYTLINKGYQNYTINNMFISFWADPDLGYAGDDLPGTDSTLNLIYTYNGSPTDAIYSPMTPPTVGFNLLEGPVVPGLTNDSAFIYGRFIKGKKNLNMTSSYFFVNGNPNYSDPPLGSSDGANQFYNFFNGDYGLTGLPFQDPQGHITKYAFPGDPVTNTGWTASQTIAPSDIRQGMSSGPFTFAPGDTQEVTFVEILSDADPYPASYLTSINNLRNNIDFINSVYLNGSAVKISSQKIVSLNKQVQFTANIFPQGAQLTSISWQIMNAPQNSNAVIADPSSLNTYFTPDLQGIYKIKLSLNINGLPYSDIVNITAINNQPPIALLKADTTEMLSTDSLFLDFRGSYDPDSDNINFQFIGNGDFHIVPGTKIAYYYPSSGSLGNQNIELIVSDAYSSDTSSINVKVDPKLIDTKINYSFIDTSWQLNSSNHINGMFYYKGNDSLYVPMLNSLRRYQITSNGIALKEESNNLKLTGIWTINNNLLFGSTNQNMGFFGTLGDVSIFDLNNGDNRILANYRPGTGDIMAFYQIGSDIYLLDSYGYIYNVDFTKPYSPIIFSKNNLLFNPLNVLLLKNNNKYLYFLGQNGNYGDYSYYIKILDKNYLSTLDSLKLPLNNISSITAHDSIIAAYNSMSDSLSFYYYDGELNPTLLKEIDCSTIFPDTYLHLNYSPYFGLSFVGNYLQLSLQNYGSALFDISDLNNIKFVAACYGGNLNFTKQGNNYFLNNPDPRFANVNNPYNGINAIIINDITGIAKNKVMNIPLQYSLSQNYPNPFNPTTIINYSVPKASFVTLKVYDVLGREVKTLVNEQKTAGYYNIVFNASKLASGVYFYRMQVENFVDAKKLILLK